MPKSLATTWSPSRISHWNVASNALATPLAPSVSPETTMPSSGVVMFISESVVVGSALVSGSDAGCAEHLVGALAVEQELDAGALAGGTLDAVDDLLDRQLGVALGHALRLVVQRDRR